MNIRAGYGPRYQVNEIDDEVGELYIQGRWVEMPYEEMFDVIRIFDFRNGVKQDD